MPQALAAVLRRAPLSEDKVAFAWRAAVGPAVDKLTRVALEDRTLRVRVRDAAWKSEIDRSCGVIHSRLESLLGQGVVRRIDVVVDRPASATPGSDPSHA